MLYISKQIDSNNYQVYDTDDCRNSIMSKSDVLKLNKQYKILGVSNNTIKVINPFDLYKRWQLLDVLDQKLKGITLLNFFGYFWDCIGIMYTEYGLTFSKFRTFNTSNTLGDIKNLVIPDGINAINMYCFSNLDNLETVKLPNSIISLNTGCFKNCARLREINIPSSVEYINSFCFTRTHIEKLYIPDSVHTLSNKAVFECDYLKELRLPKDTCDKVADHIKFYCKSLESMYIGDELYYSKET